MRKNIWNLIVICILVGLAGCTSKSKTPTWADVQQKSGPVVQQQESYLKVFSEARVYNDADITRVTRVPYTIYTAEGKKLRFVAFNDEDPQLVTLPPGKYVIVPVTNMTKTAIYGAILKSGQITEVHMKGENPLYAPANF